MSQTRYGWVPDIPDARDITYKAIRKRGVKLPSKADLRPEMQTIPIFDQGSAGSCTANAWLRLLAFWYLKSKSNATEFSRLFLYYEERARMLTTKIDSGAQIRDGAKVLAKKGCCLEPDWPYDLSKLTKRPAIHDYTNALHYKIKGYHRVIGLQETKDCLSKGLPVCFGFTVYESFEGDVIADTGKMPMPILSGPKTERSLGGHAVLAVGYDDTMSYTGSESGKGCLIVANSWGDKWGDNGYFYMPYPIAQSSNLSDDYWVVTEPLFV